MVSKKLNERLEIFGKFLWNARSEILNILSVIQILLPLRETLKPYATYLWAGAISTMLLALVLMIMNWHSSPPKKPRKALRILLISVFIVLIAVIIPDWRSILPWPRHLSVLVTEFNGLHPEQYGVTMNFYQRLRDATAGMDDVKIDIISDSITVCEGETKARKLGQKHKARIVIWGNYFVTSTDCQLYANYIFLQPPEGIPENTKTGLFTKSLADIDHYVLQTQAGQKMAYLVVLTAGFMNYAGEKYNEAILQFSKAIEISCSSQTVRDPALAYFFRGNAYVLRDTLSQTSALANYDTAATLNHLLFEAWYNRAKVLHSLQRYDEALSSYDSSLSVRHTDHDAWNNRGVVLFELGEFHTALSSFDSAIMYSSNDTLAWYNRGNALDTLSLFSDAVVSYDTALFFNRHFYEAWYKRAKVLMKIRDYQQAESSYTNAIEY
jgi:hypothetical protein